MTLAIQADFTARMVVPVGNDIELKAGFEMDARDALANAIKVDAQSQPVTSFTGFSYVEAHLGGSF